MGVSYINQVIVEQAEAVRDVTWKKTNQILDTYYGNTAVKGIVNTSALIDNLLDEYFPPIEGEEMIGKVYTHTSFQTAYIYFCSFLETFKLTWFIANGQVNWILDSFASRYKVKSQSNESRQRRGSARKLVKVDNMAQPFFSSTD